MGIYGYTRAVLGDLYSVAKIGGLRFRCHGYFINHLVISIPPTHFKSEKNISNQNGVKCKDDPVITLKLTLTPSCSVLLLKHNKGVEHMQDWILKPKQAIQYTPSNPTLKSLFTQVQHHVSLQQYDLVVDLLTQARHNEAYSKCKVNWDSLIAHHTQYI